MFDGKVVLVTGGTGSFGHAIVDRFLETAVAEIRIFSRDEKKQEDMRLLYQNPKLKFYIGDVRNQNSLMAAITGVNFIFHAAALKQVPSCEFYPMEAVRTNILGAENVMSVALARQVERVVVLSTDKAVYPINAMGMTKAIMEKLMIAKSRQCRQGETIFCATRYGNVMGSRGSVIPLFVEQANKGARLTVTDPAMTRFLMSLEDSVDLVLHAFSHGNQGDIFIQKAPSSTVGDLAQAIVEMSGKENTVQIIGTRHGEKLYETLVSREEMAKAMDMGRYFRVPADTRDLNYAKYFVEGETQLSNVEDYTSHNAERLSVPAIKRMLASLPFMKAGLGT